MKDGLLIDALYHPDMPFEERRAMIGKVQAALKSSLGAEMLSVIDRLATPKVFPMSKVSDPNAVGALIAQEAQRNFVQQLKLLASYDDRTDPGNPTRSSKHGRSGDTT